MKPIRLAQKDLNQYIAKLHLGPGDSIIVDGSAFDVTEFAKNLRVPKGCNQGMIFAAFPTVGQSLREAFIVMKETELRALTRETLLKLLEITEADDATS